MTNHNQTLSDEFYLYADELELAWRESLPRYTETEWLTIFPEARAILPSKISEWSQEKENFRKEIQSKLIYIRDKVCDKDAQEFLHAWVRIVDGQKLIGIVDRINSLKRLLLVACQKPIKGQISQQEIEAAAQVPIIDLLGSQARIRRSGRNFVCLCPFHPEQTPSFYIYAQENRWHCFGCNEHGNAIDLVRKLEQLNFPQAVKQLVGAAQ